MTKLLFCSISAFVFSVCLTQTTFAANEAVDAKTSSIGGSYISEPQEAEPVPFVASKERVYETLITDAVSLHNFVQAIDAQLAQAESYRLAVLDKEIDKARIADFDKCEVKKLSEHFKNPKDLWALLKETADEKLQEYNSNTVEKAARVEDDVKTALVLSDEDRLNSLKGKWTNDKNADIEKTFGSYKTENGKETYKSISEQQKDFYRSSKYKKTVDSESYLADKDPDAFWEDFGDSSVEWNIGFSILNVFYPNQDNFCKDLGKKEAICERKTKNTASLPLWTDQKYLYDRDVWQPKYKAIVDHCKKQKIKLVEKEPKIDDKYKYDYYEPFYEKVKAAHQSFVSKAAAQECVLTDEMKKPPVRAPRPLPPVNEEIMVLSRSAEEVPASSTTFPENKNIVLITKNSSTSLGTAAVGVYPQNPQNANPDKQGEFLKGTLWEAYKKDKFADGKVAKDGEFRSYFDKSLNLKDDGGSQTGNRISKYFELKNTAELSENMYQRYLEGRDDLATTLNGFVEKYNLQVPENMNYLSVSDLNKLKAAVRVKERELIAQAKADLGDRAKNMKNMTAEELKEDKYLSFLDALEKDKDALVSLTRESSTSIEDAIKQAKANKELFNTYSTAAIESRLKMLEEKNHNFDEETCLNPDEKKVLVDLNKVKIE